jgi:hypothetical protein
MASSAQEDDDMNPLLRQCSCVCVAAVSASGLLFGLASLGAQTGDPVKPKYSVKIIDDKTVVTDIEDSGAIDPVKRITFDTKSQQNAGFNVGIRTIRNELLHLSHFPSFMINDRLFQFPGFNPMGMGKFEVLNAALKKGPNGKARDGFMTVWVMGDTRITQTVELHPSKSKGMGQKRLMNNVMITYAIENKGNQPQKVGVRVYMDTYVITNDGCLFAAPVTHPGKILDGVVLEGKTLPPYLQMLQQPNLKNPGYVSHLTLNVGSRYEKASKLVLTRHGSGFNGWDMPANPAMFDSAIGIFWPVKELNGGAKREVAYVYGEGIAVAPESEGRFQFGLGGSFEPGKVCTITALVADPAPGQTLSLELPASMKRLEGKEVQPAPPLADAQEYSTVLWKARVLAPGQHTICVRSSTGVTQSKIVSITAEK